MKRVLVIGSGGSGKSILASRMGERLGLPVIHLDSLFWNPGWVETPKPEWRARIEDLVRQDSWIMDGNYGGTLDVRLPACDTVIFLDLPRSACLWRVVKRRIMYSHRTRPDIAEGCTESLSWDFLRWIWDYPKTRKSGILQKLRQAEANATVFVFRSQGEVEDFLLRLSV